MVKTLATTTNFVIQYQDNFANAKQRAEKLKQDAEADFATIRSWFDNNSGFGASNRVTLLVDTKSLANNNGYHSDGSTKITMHHFNDQGTSALADDAVMGLFVAEIIEVLMSCRNQQTGVTSWHAADSDGEGLSRMAVGLLHPDSYYNSSLLQGPYVNGWLQSNARNDWITSNETSDTDGDSFGCTILFLYYLHSQLGHSMFNIITKAGNTPEKTYKALTGNSGGYAGFTQFLAPFYPVGQTAALKTDNPFPLLTGQQRSVQLSFSEESNGADSIAGEGTAHVSPYLLCPVKDYHYQVVNHHKKLRCRATAHGFAQPIYTWRVNGVAVSSGPITPNATVYKDDPQNPIAQNSVTQQIHVSCYDGGDKSDYTQMSREFDIYSGDYLGHEQITVEVRVHEQYASNDIVKTSDWSLLDTQSVVYDHQFYKDREKCKEALDRIMNRLKGYVAYNPIPIILTLPDPPPPYLSAAKVFEQIAMDIHSIARHDAKAADQITHAVAAALKISPQILAGAAQHAGQAEKTG